LIRETLNKNNRIIDQAIKNQEKVPGIIQTSKLPPVIKNLIHKNPYSVLSQDDQVSLKPPIPHQVDESVLNVRPSFVNKSGVCGVLVHKESNKVISKCFMSNHGVTTTYHTMFKKDFVTNFHPDDLVVRCNGVDYSIDKIDVDAKNRLDLCKIYLNKHNTVFEQTKVSSPKLGSWCYMLSDGVFRPCKILEIVKGAANACSVSQITFAVDYDSKSGDSGNPVFNEVGHLIGIHRAGGVDSDKRNYVIAMDTAMAAFIMGTNSITSYCDHYPKNL